MIPYYKDDWVTLYLGDCREVFPELPQGDLLLTDPPYGIKQNFYRMVSRTKLARVRNYGNFEWDKAPVDQATINQMVTLARHTIMFGGNFYTMPPSSCWLVWDKDNSGDFADCELAWTNFNKAVKMYKWRWNGMLQEQMGDQKEYRYHPTQKPAGLFLRIIADWSDEGELILDPFLGSGTTCVCAKTLLRRSIGIEIEERYCEIAARRCSQGVMELVC